MTTPVTAGDDKDNVIPLRGKKRASDSPPKKKRAPKKKGLPPGFFDNLRTLVEKYVLIHGTDTAWDGLHRMVVKVSHLRLTYSGAAVDSWLLSPERRMVTKDRVVFDPTNKVSKRTHVNLFDGFEVKPKAGSCAKILELLDHLVGGDAKAREWILRWIALPLQRPGTKLATAIIMHGAEGTGKNLFWGIVQAIYGRYGTMIGQAQIESDFNPWLSAQLFIIGNEVLGRKEKWELRGALKHMVTEDVIYINEKNMPQRVERNCANLVFLSNEVQPLVLGPGDRRYMVIDCWRVHPDGKAFYDAVTAEREGGGIAAFYDYLLKLDLGDFTPHTKPPSTAAKDELVNLGKDEPDRFLDQWCLGQTAYPYGAAVAEDLYAAFRRWCAGQGERHVPSMTRFGRMVKLRLKSGLKRISLSVAPNGSVRQKTMYWDDDAVPEGCEDFDAWLRQRVLEFHQVAGEMVRGPDDGP